MVLGELDQALDVALGRIVVDRLGRMLRKIVFLGIPHQFVDDRDGGVINLEADGFT